MKTSAQVKKEASQMVLVKRIHRSIDRGQTRTFQIEGNTLKKLTAHMKRYGLETFDFYYPKHRKKFGLSRYRQNRNVENYWTNKKREETPRLTPDQV